MDYCFSWVKGTWGHMGVFYLCVRNYSFQWQFEKWHLDITFIKYTLLFKMPAISFPLYIYFLKEKHIYTYILISLSKYLVHVLSFMTILFFLLPTVSLPFPMEIQLASEFPIFPHFHSSVHKTQYQEGVRLDRPPSRMRTLGRRRKVGSIL